ncbi:hypothetical protein CK203_111535 [Vitis vinifera]|uniref:Uncharacterized protein n=1 Tax=Vitis vinifera TaxID=29760 RepID=A0A438FGE4_VITVI|nr:hypothetical protein CK203_111535 [Vitis vinifera]
MPHQGLRLLCLLHPSLLLHESRNTISISEFRGLCHTLQTLTAIEHPDSADDNYTAYRSIIGPPLTEQTMPHEELTTGEIEPSILSIPTSIVEPSSPHDPPTTT